MDSYFQVRDAERTAWFTSQEVGLAEYSAQIMAEAPEPPTGPTM